MKQEVNRYVSNAPGFIDKSRAKQLVEKWTPLLDATSKGLNGVEDAHTRLATAMILENEEKWCYQSPEAREFESTKLLSEAIGSAGTGGVFTAYNGTVNAGEYGGAQCPTNNDFYARGDARLPKILIPMIRRTFPELIANEIVGVQPMAGPIGIAFALRFKYDGNNLACWTPDGGCSMNPPISAGFGPYGFRSFGNESGYQLLNTAHTGTTAAGLSGLGVQGTATSGSSFDMVAADMGVAEILRNFECSTNLPQMSLCLEKTAVEAGKRWLAAKFSPDVEQDLQNMHGLDVEEEMINMMSYEIQAEIDRELIMRMVNIALKAGFCRGWSVWSPASADGRWQAERLTTLYAKIILEANRIAIRNRRGAANFIVATPTVIAMLEQMKNFNAYDINGTIDSQQVGVARVGILGNRFRVYRDTRTEAQFHAGIRNQELNYLLLGYKGPEYYDTGIVYCPYIPVMIQKTIGPNDFSPRIGLSTRYGVIENLFGAENYYHVIIIKDLNFQGCCGPVSFFGTCN